MKLPDNEPLEAEDYWTVTDTWKQEWERGVQVETRNNLTNVSSRQGCAMCIRLEKDREGALTHSPFIVVNDQSSWFDA